ncbi:hypothetical protein SPRG_09387 [Saprolegnia parasitica CBS 223.65]|uniref:Glycine transporter domain-containing protein n=1 Tax=Saprolegnia parasitica (strain CBS 223.65) TaxID=695850 RepID=A0A067C8E7_SAPPC|nr:hypothetical protein SPRG_09387 [Saprolegnia parasitica CBS 223.65]KDO25445.1 hypothetical protein SPRG_09387 [Saprolegnia parasitica CBS 223.65]|eukprot:XP_012203871.1 hypothetical protein SPRG_09387 [Saprolegnia parasitica CBS 223.65]
MATQQYLLDAMRSPFYDPELAKTKPSPKPSRIWRIPPLPNPLRTPKRSDEPMPTPSRAKRHSAAVQPESSSRSASVVGEYYIDMPPTPALVAVVATAVSPREGLPRWPGFSTPTGLLRCLDWFGTVVFAVSGALTAAMCGANLLGCLLIGTITAIGGGTIRDSIVLCKPPFWVEEAEYLLLSLIPAGVAFFLWGALPPGTEILPGVTLKAIDGGEGTAMQWGDAIGVGAFAVIGVMNGIRADAPFLVCALCGMMTSTFGGMVRDGLLQHPVRIMHSYADAYASIALASACVYLWLRKMAPARQGLRIAIAVALAILLREQAWTHGWRLPMWATNSQNVIVVETDPRLAR